MRVLVGVVGLIVVVGIAELAFVWNFQRGSVYQFDPTPTTPEGEGLDAFAIQTIDATDGTELSVWYAAPSSKQSVIVSFYGNFSGIGGSAKRMNALVDQGYGVAMMVYRGSNGAPGESSEDAFKADALALYDALPQITGLDIGPKETFVHGYSLGTGPAVHLAGMRDVAGVVLEGSYDRLCRFQQGRAKIAPMCRLMWAERHDVIDDIDGVNAPLLFAHGELDTSIPIGWADDLFEAAPSPKSFERYPAGTHINLMEQGLAADIAEFIVDRRAAD